MSNHIRNRSKSINSNIPLLRDLPTANKQPNYVSRDCDIKEAVTIMMANDYSQLPVMQNDRKIDGFISWRLIGEAYTLGKECRAVRNCMEPCPPSIILEDDRDLLEAIKCLVSEDFILVKSKEKDNRIIGIVTTWDITTSFIDLAEPFLLIGKIENSLRELIGRHFSDEEIKALQKTACIEKEVKSISDLTFGDYINLIGKKNNGSRFGKYQISRQRLTEHLRDCNKIRNDIMHFRQFDLDENHIRLLRNMAKFLEKLCCVDNKGQAE